MEYIKIAVLNLSGNVGKSIICQTLLKPRIADSVIISIETVNDDGTNEKKMSAHDMTSVIQKIDATDKAIIDVGSSNIEGFIKGIKINEGSHEDIDYYIVPTIPEPKQLIDTINTINMLLDMGVDSESIKVIFNKVDSESSIKSQFDKLLNSNVAKDLGLDNPENHIILNQIKLFDLLDLTKQTLQETLDDDINYKSLIRKETDLDKKNILSLRQQVKRQGVMHNRSLDIAYEQLGLVFDE